MRITGPEKNWTTKREKIKPSGFSAWTKEPTGASYMVTAMFEVMNKMLATVKDNLDWFTQMLMGKWAFVVWLEKLQCSKYVIVWTAISIS